MTLIRNLFITLTLSLAFGAFPPAHSATEAASEHAEAEAKGPNGGTLLTDGPLAVEITIYESGVPPEMRVYTYLDGELVKPDQVALEVTLHRLGNVNDELTFISEGDYLVSTQTVVEPHSYEVSVDAVVKTARGDWHYEAFEGRVTLSDRVISQANILIESAGPQSLTFKEHLFGVVAPVNGSKARVTATYRGKVTDVHVAVGDKVNKGQVLATVTNAASGVAYKIESPINGELTERFVTVGEIADEQVLFEVVDLSSVWVELSAFPENIEKLQVGQVAEVYDLHQHKRVRGNVIYIAPAMTGGHIARARVQIDNSDGHWRPGMHVRADIITGEKEVALAVKKSALQTFREMPVVFGKFGNTFEVRMVELGESDEEYVEVLGGLTVGTNYVVGNSYLLKADVLKDGASHDH
ncbi:efflux RND transporter periplasmic adaptor subunit [Pseudidiomarina sp.]|uniref:efflux RND transporter periplasmic adaptor subunit n=1 Tax=Pseudidiomarina sp. TaxID=2081707 RepID=UPI003A96E70B